jgi:hypothetical protein
VLLIHSDPQVREAMAGALRRWTTDVVVGVGSVAEVERWPRGQVVVVEDRFFTPFWLTVGAAHVIVVEPRLTAPRSESPSITCVPLDGGWSALLHALEGLGVLVR